MLRHIITFALVLAASGCGSQAPQQSTAEGARAVLAQALDGWKAGRSLKDVASDHSISASDLQWADGLKLREYEIVEEKPAVAFDRVYVVVLTLEGPKGPLKERAMYTVTDRPARTVIRAAF